jgi:Kef-type K+ transport system membrane component KefB
MITKVAAVWPTCRLFKMPSREVNYTTCMMSTGLTFGSISALYGFTYGYVTQAQYSLLVTAVIGSAVIPTVIGQIWFQPREVGLGKVEEFVSSGSLDHLLHMPED